MAGEILASSLVDLKGTELRMVYALIKNTNLGDLLLSKTKDIFDKEDNDHFTLHLEKEVEKLQQFSDSQLQVNLILHLAELLKIKVPHLTLEKEIIELAELILNKSYELYVKEDKKFKEFTFNKSYEPLQQMIMFQMNQVFEGFDVTFKQSSEEEQIQFVSKIQEYVSQLPMDKQIQIKDKLGIDDLTEEVLSQTLKVSSASVVFAIIVEVSGFAFYTTATSLVATLASIIGVTVPFGVYTGITSTVAILSSPFFIIPLLLGGGTWLVNYQNNNFKKKLLPITIMQIALPYMTKEVSLVDFDSFIEEWKGRFNKYVQFHEERKQILEDKKSLMDEIDKKKKDIQSEKRKITHLLSNLHQTEKDLKQVLIKKDNLVLPISEKYLATSKQYRNLIEPYEVKITNSLFKNSWNSFVSSVGIRSETDKLINELYREVLRCKPIQFESYYYEHEQLSEQLEQAQVLKTKLESKLMELESRLAELAKREKINLKEIVTLEKSNYGFSDLYA